MGKKKASVAAPGAGGAETRKCVECGEAKEKAGFPVGVWKSGDRQCSVCREAEEALLAPATARLEAQREAERTQRAADEAAKRERLQNAPLTEKAKARLRLNAQETILRAVPHGATTPPLTTELTDAATTLNITTHTIEAMHAAVHAAFTLRALSERALSSVFTASLGPEALEGLGVEVGLSVEECSVEREVLIERIRKSARETANSRVCEECGKTWKKVEFSQSQWKKVSGARCKLCMEVLENERRYFEEFERMYGHRPAFDDDEEVYTSQENLYHTLRLEMDATEEELKKAYRTLAIKYHPDRWYDKGGSYICKKK